MTSVSHTELGTIFYSAIGGVLLVYIIRHGYGIMKFLMQYWKEQSKINKFAELVPGPKPLPILGNLLELRETDNTIHTLMRIRRELNSRFYKLQLGPTIVKFVVSDPDDLKILYNSTKAGDKDDFYKNMEPVLVNSLINAPVSSRYRAHKKMMIAQVNGKSVMDTYVQQFNHHSRLCVKLLEKQVDAGEFDAHDVTSPLLADIVFETICEYKGTAQAGNPNELLEYVPILLHIIYHRTMRPHLYPDFIFRLTKQGKLFYSAIEKVHAYVDSIIAEKKKQHRMVNAEDTSRLCWLDFHIDHMIKTKDWTEEDIRYEGLTVFIAAYDTITGVMDFLLLLMAMHPEIQEKAREEVQNVMHSDDLLESEINHLHYIDMTIRETMRLFPPAPLLARRLNADLRLSRYTLPKGSSVFLFPFAVFKDPEYWDEPEKFNPDRFTPENSKNRHPYAYIPFSAGIRSCPGSKYAMHCIKVITAHILRNYALSTNMKLEDVKIHAHISIRSVNGYKIFLGKL